MQQGDAALTTLAEQIKNEIIAGANTTTRNGNMLEAIIDSKASITDLGIMCVRGFYDASTNLFPDPTVGANPQGRGDAGAILAGDCWRISVAGTLGGVVVVADVMIIAWISNPGQTLANWKINQG